MKKLATDKKKIYSQPECIVINLDIEISLALESDPPVPDGESNNQLKSNEFFNSDPYSNIV